eukprot:CAMPEP_0198315238 /NCGR_PEP_ID=MMETSP1450-20131203/5580_1 /TAXON_ID=753684 ORGANISM="Madagascaria erythrocladiodes, Strain CCMP3234" /NCGR_SAMPLE_ID=MMETSP1450 /ASSEMBLY_ACC=CAM_ASM_001115 /LENGTH=503 /DNA_ID=CAMNT_0044018345 /DNA_START=113 /DNA_END=1624 /DNA_ORIENTATION=-
MWVAGAVLVAAICTAARGQGLWSPVTEWPMIPVGVFHLDDNRILGFAANQADDYTWGGGLGGYTHAAIYDPATGSFERLDLVGHDTFCSGLTFLPNGDLFLAGGGNGVNPFRVSRFDMAAKQWVREHDTNKGHWYGTAVATLTKVVLALGVATAPNEFPPENNIPEISYGFDFSLPWSDLYNVSLEGKGPDVTHWYPQMHLLSNGKILESGTQNEMFIIDPEGAGSIVSVGLRNPLVAEREAWGVATIMFDVDRILTIGGLDGWYQGPTKFTRNRVMLIDARDPENIVSTQVADMAYHRAFMNAVLAPTGDVYVFGGQSNNQQWNDSLSVLVPEVYNPATNIWTPLASMATPRNYHSTAILLHDGRMFVGGGGLCGWDCEVNHKNHEIFTPPYLLEVDGITRRPQGTFLLHPPTVTPGVAFTVQVNLPEPLAYFMWIRHYSVTHSISTDQRGFRAVSQPDLAYDTYHYITPEANRNIMTPGNWFLFAVTTSGTPSLAATIKVI